MKKTILVFLALLTAKICSQTVIHGVIKENTWWTKENSPYILTNDLVIAPFARLVIEPGVTVMAEKPLRIPDGIEQIDHLDSFTVAIKVLGALHAVGTPTDHIIFMGKDVEDDRYTHWYGIYVDSRRSEQVTLAYTTVSSAVNGIFVKNGMPMIRNVLFEFNHVGLRAENRASLRAVHCVFTKNYLAAVRVINSNPYIYNSIFVDNVGTALWGDGKVDIPFRNNIIWNNGRDFLETDARLGVMRKLNPNGDSTDFYGNLRTDPVFVGSQRAEFLEKSGKTAKNVFFHDRLDEIEDKRFFLSPYSPAVDAGINSRMFRESDGSAPDIGIWGGADHIRF